MTTSRTGTTASTDRVVVASVPAGHAYVRHLAPLDGGGPVRLADPVPAGEPATTQRWWPPAMLDPAWVSAHDVDVMHVHFGFDACSPADLRALVAALRARGTPLVLTVHDLRNPHHHDRRAHDDQLDVLVPAADALITLTQGASCEIRRRWGRDVVVLPHPHVVPLERMQHASAQTRPADRPFRVGLHVKSLRASMEPGLVLPTLVETVAGLPGAVLQVNAHHDVLRPGGPRHDPDLAARLLAARDAGLLELHEHDYLDDDALWDYLAGLDVSVLPYRFGTHSGWLEACRDLGTTVVAPTCGYYADQGPVLSYRLDEQSFDPVTLADAVRLAYETRVDLGVSVDERVQQRRMVAAGHDLVYSSVLR